MSLKIIQKGKYKNIIICDNNHKFEAPLNATYCPTCRATGFYKILLDKVSQITKMQWVVQKSIKDNNFSKRTKYIYNIDIGCKIGARYGKYYDNNTKLDIEIKNKFPSMEMFNALLSRELKKKLYNYFENLDAEVNVREICHNIKSYEVEFDKDLYHIETEINNQLGSAIMGVSYDKYVEEI